MQLKPDAPQLTWQGAISLQQTEDWMMPWRTPHPAHILFPEPLLERSAMPAGVRISFRSNTTQVSGNIVPQNESGMLDLCCNGELIDSIDLKQQDSFAFENLSNEEKLIELWLPQFGRFQLRSLEIDDGATLEPFTDTRPRWITYGSSITQCRTAASPTQTWPGIVARTHGLNLTCLGYGGQCHLDAMVARMIRDTPADYISMCLGINIQGASSLGQRTFRPAIIGAVQIVREKQPDIPIVLMSPICSPPREENPNTVGFHLKGMREEVQAAAEALQAHGDKQVHYVDGLSVFGADYVHLLPDDLHPDAEGYRVMGKNFITVVAEKFFV
ncbi:GDSL family lipase [Candidatus Poribacteria bacterium]|nr:MAG: GDSL family lipase [Candidatus Poribacteria bacterium]